MGIIDDIAKAGRVGLRRWVADSDDDVDMSSMGDALTKAGLTERQRQTTTNLAADATEESPRALFHDPYSILDWGGWRQRPSSLTYESLRQMSLQASPIAAIVQLRVNQISQFCRPQQSQYDKGYRVVLRDRRDKRPMSPQEQKMAREIERMLETTGYLLPFEKPTYRDSFRSFTKKSVRDILVYDQWVWEKQRDRHGRPSRFIALDGASVRPAVSDVEHMRPEEHRERVAYVQIYENTVVAEFSPDDLAWCIMNPRADLRVNGFGLSPIEQIVRLVTAWLFGFQYNQNFFSQGSAIKGLINIKGAIPDKQMRAFRRMWYTMISGVNNAWRTPILNSDEIQWVSMHSANREMEYSSWMDWLTKLICAVYGVDPVEINFQFGNTGQSSSLNEGSQESKVIESKDKGLRPLVEHITDHINQHLIWELCEDFEFGFVGLDAKAEQTEREARIKESAAFKTVDEVRAEMDLPPMPKGQGEMIRDAQWVQYTNAQDAQQQQPGMGGDMPGAPGGEGEDPLDEDDDLLSAPAGEDDDSEQDEDDDLLSASFKDYHEQLRKAVSTIERLKE